MVASTLPPPLFHLCLTFVYLLCFDRQAPHCFNFVYLCVSAQEGLLADAGATAQEGLLADGYLEGLNLWFGGFG